MDGGDQHRQHGHGQSDGREAVLVGAAFGAFFQFAHFIRHFVPHKLELRSRASFRAQKDSRRGTRVTPRDRSRAFPGDNLARGGSCRIGDGIYLEEV